MKRSMFRSRMILLLVISLCISLVPAPVSAAHQLNVDQTLIQQDEDVTSQQIFEEALRMTLADGDPLTEEYYVPEVLKEIDSTYGEAVDYVAAHPESVSLSMFGVAVSDEVYVFVSSLEALVTLDRSQYKGAEDVGKLKALRKTEYNDITEGRTRQTYNDWYWEKYVVMRDQAKKLVENISSLKDYTRISGCDLFVAFSEFYYYDLETFDPSSRYVFTKDDIAALIEDGQASLTILTETDKNAGYPQFVPSAALKKQIAGFTGKARKYEDVNEIHLLYMNIKAEYQKEYDAFVAERAAESPLLTGSDRIRWENRISAALNSYDHRKYSTGALGRLQNIADEYIDKLQNCITEADAEIVYNNCIKEMKAVPVLSAELKKLRKARLRSWNKKYKTKAYHQTKVTALIKQGSKAMSAAKTVEDLKAVYKKYTKKLDNTIRTFRVKVSKKGKGTVSVSKKTVYGRTYTIRLQPAPGHALKSVRINGKKKPVRYTYRFKAVKNTVLKVVFK